MRVSFVVPGNPVPWQRARSARGQRFTAPETRIYRDKVRAHAHNARVRPLAGPVQIACVFHRSTRHACDIDNLIKTVLDALNGVAYADDRQVVHIVARKAVDASHPRAEIEIGAAA